MKGTSIFTKAEVDAINKRLKGDNKDPTGIYTRAKKKLIEIQAWNTSPDLKKKIKKLIGTTKNNKPRGQNFEDFKKNTGY